MKPPTILDPEAFSEYGFFIRRGFLSLDLCTRLRRAMGRAPDQAGEIWVRGRSTLARRKRNVRVLTLSPRLRADVDRAFRKIQPLVGQHFGRKLSGLEEVQFLRYPEGGLYVLHTDRTPGTRDPVVRKRKVSIIVFLSRTGRGKGEHLGGELVFPWAPRKGRKSYPLAPRAEPGLLVAFDPGIEHEVRRVRGGPRCSIATWYF